MTSGIKGRRSKIKLKEKCMRIVSMVSFAAEIVALAWLKKIRSFLQIISNTSNRSSHYNYHRIATTFLAEYQININSRDPLPYLIRSLKSLTGVES